MKRKLLSLPLLFIWLLAACKPSAPTPTPAPEIPTPATKPTVQATTAPVSSMPKCTVTSRNTNANQGNESPMAVVTEKDWVEGPSDAYVTIIEYGDFQ